jgi:hypothetical protein
MIELITQGPGRVRWMRFSAPTVANGADRSVATSAPRVLAAETIRGHDWAGVELVDIKKWDAGTWIAAAGAVIALIAAAAAWSQARLAKRSAGAADVQAAAAQVQAEAARVQAEAAQEQVILTRQQLATAKANSHEAAAPGFIFPASTIRGTGKGEKPVAHITVKQVGGGRLSQVTATVTCGNDVLGFIADDGSTASTTTWTNSAADSTHELKVGLAKAEPVDVVLDFMSVGTDPGKTWESSRTTRPVLPSRPIAFGTTARR